MEKLSKQDQRNKDGFEFIIYQWKNGIGIEISEKYCEIAKKRIESTTKPLF